MANENEEQIVGLELRFMKLERFTHELSDVVAEQGKMIDALRLELKRMRERQPDEGPMPNDAPPHY